MTPRKRGRLYSLLRLAERAIIEAALRACHGNRTRAARRLGITRSYLQRFVRQYGITIAPQAATATVAHRGPRATFRCGWCGTIGHTSRAHRAGRVEAA